MILETRIGAGRVWQLCEIKRGFHHADGGIVRLMASVGLSRTMDIVLTGREISAKEALQLGLVSRVVLHEDLMSEAVACASELLNNSLPAMLSAKETILEIIGRPLDDALQDRSAEWVREQRE